MGKALEDLRIYRAAESLCDDIWHNVTGWERFARDTVGKQLVQSSDSIGANIAEGYGQYHFRDDIKFLYYARGSAKETGFWLRRAQNRSLMELEKCSGFIEDLTLLEPQLNAYINSIRRKANETHVE